MTKKKAENDLHQRVYLIANYISNAYIIVTKGGSSKINYGTFS